MLGNGVVGILAELCNTWERRAPLCPLHCACLLHNGREKCGVNQIIIQPSTKRIYHDAHYEDVGCTVSEDLSECGLIVGIKQPKLDMILPEKAYAFFSHTHKAQKQNMPLLDKILAEKASLFDYELIIGDDGKRLLAFGKYAGRAGTIDFLSGLGKRYLNLGYSTPFLSLGASYMYPSLAAAKAAVVAVGEEIAASGLPSGICPLIFVFTGSGNVSEGAQEIFKLLPHSFVEPAELPGLYEAAENRAQHSRTARQDFQVYGCAVTYEDLVAAKDSVKGFDKADYYAHPEHYHPIFHERIAPYASVIVNCLYWEKRFPRLLTTKQLQVLYRRGCPLVGFADISCDVGGSLEFINQTTSIEMPFFRYNPLTDTYHFDMEGDGVICLSVDILPTEFAREASQHFGDILSQFVGDLAFMKDIQDIPSHLRRACIAHRGSLTSSYEYIFRMRSTDPEDTLSHGICEMLENPYKILVPLSGHLFDQFLINKALDIIEAAGGSFRLSRCDVGQSTSAISSLELEVSADDRLVLDQIIKSLKVLSNLSYQDEDIYCETKKMSLQYANDNKHLRTDTTQEQPEVLILGAGRVCHPAVQFLTYGLNNRAETHLIGGIQKHKHVKIIVASLFLKDAEEVTNGMPNATAVQLDIKDSHHLFELVKQVKVVISLLPSSCHVVVANACLEFKKHLVTASYLDEHVSRLNEKAESAGITILSEMGLDPGIDHMLAMRIINEAHQRGGKISFFASYCGGLPSPTAANNPLGYKFSWNPIGAIKAGWNAAAYKSKGQNLRIEGGQLYDSATPFRIPYLPAFALECLPNRDSLIYGDLYGIGNEALTILRGTLRYEGFSEIMSCLAKVGLFNEDACPTLNEGRRTTFRKFFCELLKIEAEDSGAVLFWEKAIMDVLISRGHCKQFNSAVKTAMTIGFLGLYEDVEIPSSCRSAFDITCSRMQERLSYASAEQDMVLLHHEVKVSFPDGQTTENHCATLLELGVVENGCCMSAMARAVGVTAAIGALLLLENIIKMRGVIRPTETEVYIPALSIIEACGFQVIEKVEIKQGIIHDME